jgi:hypothetical protein
MTAGEVALAQAGDVVCQQEGFTMGYRLHKLQRYQLIDARNRRLARMIVTSLTLVLATSTTTVALASARLPLHPGSPVAVSPPGRLQLVHSDSGTEGTRAESDSYVETLLRILRHDSTEQRH